MVAFANTQGGVIYLGVEDDGRVTGLHPDHRNVGAFAAFIANRTSPPVSARVELMEQKGLSVLAGIIVGRKAVPRFGGHKKTCSTYIRCW